MNEDLVKFIELCLIGGPITEHERSVIFKKADNLGVPRDECELILRGMISQHNNTQESQKKENKQFNTQLSLSEDVYRSVNQNILGYMNTIEKIPSIKNENLPYQNILQGIKTKYASKTSIDKVLSYLDMDGSGFLIRKAFRPESMLPQNLKNYIRKNANKGFCVYFNKDGLEVDAYHWNRKWTLLTIWFTDRVIYHYGEQIGTVQPWAYEGNGEYILFKDAQNRSLGKECSRLNKQGYEIGFKFRLDHNSETLENHLNDLLANNPKLATKEIIFKPTLLTVTKSLRALLDRPDLDKESYNVIHNLTAIEKELNERLFSVCLSGSYDYDYDFDENKIRPDRFLMHHFHFGNTYGYNEDLIEDLEKIITDISDFSVLCATVINLFELRRTNQVEYRKLLAELEQIGLTFSKFENTVVSELKGIRNAIDSLTVSLSAKLSAISSQIGETNYSLEKLNSTASEASKKLDGVKSSLDLNNLLTGVAIYQNYKQLKK